MSDDKLCIGIDLGTTNSCLAYFNPESEQVEIIPNSLGDRITPSVVKYQEDGSVLVGRLATEAAEDEGGDSSGSGSGSDDDSIENPYPVISHVKRFIGKKFQDSLDIAGMVDYTILPDHNDNPFVHVGVSDDSDGGGGLRKLKAEEVSAQVLRYLKEYGEEYLGRSIGQAVVTCFDPDTEVLLANGKTKLISDINISDKLMGDDGLPRDVISVRHGNAPMYLVQQSKGIDYIVTKEHILVLRLTCVKPYIGLKKGKRTFFYYKYKSDHSNFNTVTKRIDEKVTLEELLDWVKTTEPHLVNEGDIIEMSVEDYLKCNQKKQKTHLKGYKVPKLSGKRICDIPCLVKRKQIPKDLKFLHNTSSSLKITPITEYKGKLRNKYVAVEVNGNSRFLLKDCTVVHNCPAYFGEAQRRATRDACMIAGLECLRLVAEPTAACLCYGLHKSNHEVVLVYDLGGGTLDVSILELHGGIFEVLATSGNSQLGGADVDHLLRDYLEKLYREKTGKSVSGGLGLSFAEGIKKNLSNLARVTVRLPGFKYVLSRSEFEEQMMSFVEAAMEPVDQVLEDAGLSSDDISQVVLVGGSTRLPIIQKKLLEIFPQRPLNKSINPDEAVAYGAAVQASILKNVGSRSKEMILLDVNPLSLGIETTGGIMNVLIKRNSTLPCEAKKVFSTVDDNQEVVEIKVFQGERQFTADNIQLSTFLLEGLPRAARGVPKIVVTFKLNCDGLLSVTAVDKNTGLENSVSIQQESNLDETEIQKMIQDAEKFKTQDYNRRQAIDEYNRFEAHIYEMQRQVNLPEMDVVLGDEKSQLNQYLINTVEWLVANRDADLETIQACRENVDFNLKPYLNRMYSHQEDLEKSGIGNMPRGEEDGGTQAIQEMVDDICADLDS